MIEIIREETLEEREERRKRESQTGEREKVEKEKEETEEKKDFGIPKNIRQIGSGGGREKIYIEDYVMTHMKQLAAYEDDRPQVLILYGKKQIIDGQLFWFVSGAVLAEAIDSFMDQIEFEKELWAEINHTANNFFKGLSVVGWAMLRKNSDSYWDEKIVAAHKKYFHPGQKIFFEYIINERSENMYLFEKGKMNRQSGFFIYYERNEPMQNYMVAYKEKETEPEEEFTGDKATKQFRAIVQEKKDRMHKRHTMGLLYGTSIVLVMVIMVIGITMLNNYEKMQNMEQVLYKISGQMEDVQTDEQVSVEESESNDAEVVQTGAGGGNNTIVLANTENGIDEEVSTNIENVMDGEAAANSEVTTSREYMVNQENSKNGETTANQAANANGEATSNQETTANGQAKADSQDSTNGQVAADSQDSTNGQVTADSRDSTNGQVTADSQDSTNGQAIANQEATKNVEATTKPQSAVNQEDDSNTQVATSTTTIPKEYVIQKGDTLAKISRKFYGTENMIQKICELNHIQDMDNILYGEKIILPEV